MIDFKKYKCSYILFSGLTLYFMGNRYLQYFVSDGLCSLSSLLGMFLILIALLFYSTGMRGIDFPARVLFVLFLLSNLFVVLHGFVDSGLDVGALVAAKREVPNYLTPLLMLCFWRCFYIKPCIVMALVSCLLGLLFVAGNVTELVLSPAILSMGFFDTYIVNRISVPLVCVAPSFLLLLYKDVPVSVKRFVLVSTLVSLVVLLLSGRRSGAFTILLCYLCYFAINIKRKGVRLALFMCGLAVLVLWPMIFDAFGAKFSFLMSRLGDDTRSGVEHDLIRDMDAFSWIFGRGLYGTYYSPTAIDSIHRGMIETGYLHMILKGGMINLTLYVALLLRTVYNGIFKSRNNLAVAFGYLALMYLVRLYPGGHINMTFEFCILWFGIAFCNYRRLYMASNDEIKKYL